MHYVFQNQYLFLHHIRPVRAIRYAALLTVISNDILNLYSHSHRGHTCISSALTILDSALTS